MTNGTITRAARRYRKWVGEHEEESREARIKRLNRERVRRHRERKAAADVNLPKRNVRRGGLSADGKLLGVISTPRPGALSFGLTSSAVEYHGTPAKHLNTYSLAQHLNDVDHDRALPPAPCPAVIRTSTGQWSFDPDDRSDMHRAMKLAEETIPSSAVSAFRQKVANLAPGQTLDAR
jgi:hypothetical protein